MSEALAFLQDRTFARATTATALASFGRLTCRPKSGRRLAVNGWARGAGCRQSACCRMRRRTHFPGPH